MEKQDDGDGSPDMTISFLTATAPPDQQSEISFLCEDVTVSSWVLLVAVSLATLIVTEYYHCVLPHLLFFGEEQSHGCCTGGNVVEGYVIGPNQNSHPGDGMNVAPASPHSNQEQREYISCHLSC